MKKIHKKIFSKTFETKLFPAIFSKGYQLAIRRSVTVKSKLDFNVKWPAFFSKIPLVISFSLLAFCAHAQNKVTGISVSSIQTGSITYGTSSSVTYDITLASDGGSPDGSTTLSLNWVTPAGVTFSPSTITIPSGAASTDVTLTLSSDGSTPAGTYNFTVTSTDSYGAVTSGPASSFVVAAAPLTITANDQNKIYGASLTLGTSAFIPTGLVNGETIGSVTLTSTGAINTANAGTYTIAASAATGGTFDPANYAITYVDGSLAVGTAPLTITANDQNKIYGASLTLGTSAFIATGLVNGETIGSATLISAGAINTADAGTYPISASAATGGTFDPANYTITYVDGSLAVGAAPLTITANDGTKAYGTTYTTGAGSTLFASAGLQNGETIGSITLASTGAVNTAAAGTYSIVPSAASGGTFNATNYIIVYANGALTVTQATLTITANDGTKAYGTTYTTGAGSTLFTSTGLQNGETIGSISIASTGAVNTAAAGTYSIVPSAATGGTFNAANYAIVYANGTLTVTQATLTITANDGTKAYGTTYTTGAGSTLFTSTGLQNGETIGSISIASTGAVNTAAAGTYSIVPSAATGGTFNAANYIIVYANGTLTVTQATLTITANDGTKAYGTTYTTGAGSTLFTSTGLQNGETIGSITVASTGAVNTAAAGTYSIVPSAATGGTFSAANYTIVYANGTLTVTQATLTITANDGTKAYGTIYTTGAGSTLFTSSGLQNGETIGSITIASTGAPAAATVAGSPYNIIPSAATGGTFNAANYTIVYANGTLTVTKPTLTITANNGTKAYGTIYTTGTGSTLFTSTGLQNGETIGSVTIASTGAPAAATVAGSPYNITPSAATGGTFNAANYTIVYANGTLTVTQATLTITANNGTKAYGATYTTGAGSTLFTSTGLQNGETIGSITVASSGAVNTAAVGTYPIVPSVATGGTFNAANYTIVYANGTLTVTKPTLTITANNGTKAYGTLYTTGAGSTLFTSTGLQNGETIGSITIASTGAPAAATVAGSPYSIVPSAATGGTFNAANYTIVYANGTLAITKPTLTITANNGAKAYGTIYTTGAGSTLFTSTGLQNGETIGSVTIASTGAPAAATVAGSPYNIIPSAATGGTFNAANYTIVYANGTLTVTQATLTITANNGTKVYGTTYTTGAGSTLFTSAGLQNGETIGSITIASTGAINTAVVGTYPIVPSTATGGTFNAANYTITYSNGTLTVTQATPSIVVTSNNNPACFGSSITFTATITSSPTATGQVQFFDGATSLGTVSVSGNVATLTTSALTAGSHSITAKYLGDANFTVVTSSILTQAVNAPPVTTGVTICQGGSGSLTSSSACAAGTPGTAGPNFAGAGTDNSGTGSVAWSGTGNIISNNSSYATVSVSSGGTVNANSHYLQATNFGFAIPANAIISGIQVSIKRFSSLSNSTNNIQDNVVSLINAGSVVGNDNSIAGNWSTTTSTVVNYGTASDLWGAAWTPAQINAANFGVALSVNINRTTGNTVTASVDYITVTVAYTIPGTLNWYTVSSGGSPIGNGSPFNPVGVAGSGLPNTNTPGTYTFYAECGAAPGCRTATSFLINPLPTITGNLSICTSGTTTTQLTGSGTPAATNPWVSGTPGVATINSTGLVTEVSAGTSVITYTNNNGCQITATVTITQPTITGTLSACISGTTQLTGSGTPAAVNPWISGSPAVATISNSGLVTGVTAGTSVITYTNNNGCTVNTTVTINPDATIALTSAAGTNVQTVCINSAIISIKYTIGGSGTGATVTGLPGGLVTGFAGGVFTISGSPSASGTFNYTVTAAGPCIKPSLSGTITVMATPSASAAGSDQTICTTTASTTLAANTPGIGTGTWSITSGPSTSLSQISNLNNPTATFTPAAGAGTYALLWTISNGPCATSSDLVNIIVNTAPSIISNPGNQTTCAGTATTFSVTASGTSPTYQWQYSLNNIAWSNVVNGTPTNITYSNATTTTLTVTPAAAAASGTYYYRCVVSVGGCSVVNSNSGTLTLFAKPTASAAGVDQTICTTTTSTTLAANTPANGTGTWSITSGPSLLLSQFSNVNNPTATFTPAAGAGTYALLWTISNGPCTVSSDFVNVIVNTAPSIISNPANQITCAGTSKTFSVTASGTSPTYQWQYSPDGSTWSTVFNSTPANFTYANSTTATITVTPSAAAASGTYFYRCMVNVGGCSVVTSLPATLTVNVNSTILLSSAPGTSAQTVCNNSAITNITYAIGGGGTGASITSGSLPAGVTGTYSSNVFTISGTPTVAGTFNYTITTTGPCTQATASGSIIVNALPTSTFIATETSGLANNDNIICTGATVTFTATAGYGSYIFKVNGVAAQTGTANIFNSNTLPSGASVTVDIANGFNCGATFGPIVITVNPLPSPTLIASKNPICPGDLVTFTAGGGTNYTFKVNGSSVQSGASVTYTSNSLNNGDIVTVDVKNTNGCIATSAPVNMIVNPVPSGTLAVSPGTTICAGASLIFTATSGFSTYEFKVNGTTVQGPLASNTYTSNALTNGQVVTVIATNSSGCSATFNAVAITVNAIPAGTFTASETSGTINDNLICSGAPVIFAFDPGFSNYNFKVNGTSVQNGPSNSYTNTTLGNGDIVTVVVGNSSGCNATFTAPAITIVTSPLGSLAASLTSICAGDNVTFTATPGFANYNFKINGATAQNGATNTFSSTSIAGGDVITVDVSNSNGCLTTFNSVSITVNPLPAGVLTITENSGIAPNDGIICIGANVIFTAPGGFTNYDFQVNGTSVQSGPSNIYATTSLADGDDVSVTVSNSNGCIATLNDFTITVHTLPAVQPITGTPNVCVNSTITLADATTGGVWSSLNPAIATIDAAGVVMGVSAGTATVNYTITNANGCSITATTSVTVNALPVVATITGNVNVCISNTSQLSDVTAGGTWSSDNTGVATVDVTGLVTGVSPGTATLSYTVTNGNGCTTIVTTVVTVNALPVVAPVTGTLSVCVNSTTPLADITAGGVWSSGNSAVATINASGVVTGIAGGTSVITYSVTDANGCSAASTATITVNALPTPTLVGPNPICLGSIDNVYTTESGQFNYVWNVVNGTATSGGTSTDNTITVSWLTPGAKSINVNYTDANGCTGATSATVVNGPGSSPTITGPTPVCQNSTGNIYVTETGKINYTWNVTGGTITSGGTTTDNTATITWNVAGAKSVTVNYSDVAGCDAATPTVYNVTVNPQPTVVIHTPAAVCSPSTVNLTLGAITAGSTAGLTYTHWTDAAATISYSTPATAGGGTYYIKGTTVAGCYDIEPVTVTVNPTPSLVITNPAAVCSPSTVDLTLAAVTSGSTTGLTLTYWTNAAATTSYATPTTAGAGTYYIKGTTAAGCFDIKPVVVTVNPTPTLVTHDPTAVCSPSTADLTLAAVTSGSTGGLTLTYWTDAAATLSYSTPATAGAGTYYIKGTTVGGCYDIKPVTVTVNPTPTVVTNNPAAVCSPSTVDLTLAAVTSGSTAGLTFTYWTNATATTSYPTPTTAGAGTYYIKGTTAAGCSDIKPVTVSVNPSPTVVITNPAAVCAPSTVNLTLAGVTTGSTAGLTYTYWTNATATTAYATPTTAGAGTYYIKGTTALGCFDIKPVTVTVNPLPVIIITNPAAACSPATVNITAAAVTAGSTAGLTYTYWTNATATTSFTTPTTAGAGTYYIKGTSASGCFDIKPVTVIVNTPPAVPTITPATASVCQGSVLPLTSGTAPSTTNVSFASGTINLAIPDNSSTGAANAITVSGIPAGAVINSVSVNFNITHTSDDDLRINLKAPNGNVLNLVNSEGGSGNNFTNTTISSTGVTSLFSGSAPFTATYAPDALFPAFGATTGGGNNSNVTSFSSLFSIPNGNWMFSARDIGFSNTGTILNWNITINYTTAAVPQAVTWSPVTDLYTDAGATTAYAGQSLATVYTKPATAGTKVYTATATNGAGCTNSTNVTLTVNPVPVVSIFADYCVVAGKVRLTATSTPAGATYVWSTGQTGSFIDVDIADDYNVVASFGTGCSTTATISVAQELVVNGDFSAGNTGFTSDYAYKPDLPGLVPAGQGELYDDSGNNGYSITPDGQNVHANFWGHDHTTGSGNFMAVNGHGNTLVVWKETVNVLPNTTYYFSAWAMSLNSSGNNATLQFSVNGTLVGTTAVLANHNTDNNRSSDNWTRFYGTWTSGPTTTSAVIYINDLQAALSGNDFGIDDVSFGTLSTFVELESAPGTDAQTPCINTAITPIVYSVGSTATGPTIVGLPPGVTTSFNGVLFTITGTPTVAGNYSYTITTTGTCNPSTATGSINVQTQSVSLSSGSSSPTVCVNSSMNIGYTLGGTATGATVTGLPAGVTPSVVGTTLTISGIPTVSGIYPYTITTSGTCTPVTSTGTITVQSQTITLNSANSTQSVCINSPIVNIQYTVGGTGTGATVSGLPPGVTGTFSSGLFIISGSPTSAAGSPYNYTVTTTGPCATVTATGSISITPGASLTLTSAAGTNPQTVCNNGPMIPVTYSINNATGASITAGALPAGVVGNFSGGVFTISGTPTTGGVFNYTITTSGGCGFATVTGTITVQAQTVTLTSGITSPTVCPNTPMADIVYTVGGTATGATVTGLPAGISFSIAGNVITIGGTPTVPGSFAYTVSTSGTCGVVTANGTITVSPVAIGGTLASALICSGTSGNVILSGQVGTIQHWEISTDGGTTWTILPTNTTTTQSYNNITQPTMYRVAVSRSGCNVVYSTVATLSIHNLWTGITSIDWNTASNWSGNVVPSISCPNVYIPGGTPNQPTLSSGTATINNLQILAGATLTVNSTGALQIAGTITNTGTFDVSNGAIELNGTSPQTIAPNTFMGNAIKDLVISNSAGTGITLAGPLNVYNSLTYNAVNGILNTGGFLTLKSNATGTAWIGNMTNHTIIGDVTVERYIGTGTTHAKSWQLLAVPTTGQTIKQSWEEGATATNVSSPAAGSAGNPFAGFGTMLTSDVAGAASQPNPGFDAFTSPGPSIKVYNSITDGYNGPANTGLPIYNQKGYFILVRGDRSVYTSAGAANPTVLRTKGTLFTPANPPPSTTVLPNLFESVGNPYASAIDLRSLSLPAGINSTIIVWDPTLGIGSANGLGAYQTLYLNGGNYVNLLPSIAYGIAGTTNNLIQSGQGFIIQALPTLGGTLSFSESNKASGSNPLVLRPSGTADDKQSQLRTTLYGINANGTYVADGTLIQYKDTYTDSIDGLDARKMANTAENLAVKTAGKFLSIERRNTITAQDTIFLNLTGVKVQQYQFQFDADNLNNGIEGFLEDNYLHSRTPLNMSGSTLVNFSIANVAGSYANDRFRIVFAPVAVLPVTFTSVKAYRQDKNINVEWKVENEMNIKEYVVEKSTNGTQFSTLTITPATANGGRSANYVATDITPVDGYNYYRVKSVDINGKTAYTNIVKVMMGSIKQDITIYPNPITDGMIHLQLMNQPEGKYGIRLLNKLGQVIVSKEISHAEGNSTELIKWDYNLAHGMYQLEVIKPDGSVRDINVIY